MVDPTKNHQWWWWEIFKNHCHSIIAKIWPSPFHRHKKLTIVPVYGEVYCYQYSKFTYNYFIFEVFLVLPPFNIEVCNFKIPLPKALGTARKSWNFGFENQSIVIILEKCGKFSLQSVWPANSPNIVSHNKSSFLK